MSRIAAPMVGGMVSSMMLTLGVIPVIYALVKQWRFQRELEEVPSEASSTRAVVKAPS